MDKFLKEFRRNSGWARFERECRCTTFDGRMVKAYRVPGTREHGRREMFRHAYEQLKELKTRIERT